MAAGQPDPGHDNDVNSKPVLSVTWLAAPLQTGASGPENSRQAESFLSLSGIDRD